MPKFFKRAGKMLRGLAKTGIKLFGKAQEAFNQQVVAGEFDMEDAINDNDFNNESRPSRVALDWWLKWRKVNATKYKRKNLEVGKAYGFRYLNPKTKDVLEYYDTSPIIITIGQYKNKDGKQLIVGLNLHFLPEKVRKQAVTKVFDMFRNQFRGQMYSKKQRPIDSINWRKIEAPLRPFGISFCVRSYFPERMTNLFEIPYELWSNIPFIPSEKYVGIHFQQLKGKWAEHVRKELKTTSSDRLADMITANFK